MFVSSNSLSPSKILEKMGTGLKREIRIIFNVSVTLNSYFSRASASVLEVLSDIS